MLAALAALLLAAAPTTGSPPADRPTAAPERSARIPSADAARLAAKVQSAYERTRDLEARFQQTYVYAGLGRRQLSSGRLLVKKPGMMRWDYEKPVKKTIAVRGSRLVQYEPDENQAYVDDRFDASAMSAAVTFLLGKGDLAKEFDLGVDPSGALLLTPREPDPRVESIALTVDADGQVTATRVRDGSGNVNEIRFEDVRRNRGIPDSAFEVKLSKDVHRIAAPG